MPGFQFMNAFHNAFRTRSTHGAEHVTDRCPVQPSIDLGKLKQHFQLRPKRKPSVDYGIEERLYSQTIAGQQQCLSPFIPEGKGEHAAHLLHAPFLVLLVEVRVVRGEAIDAEWRGAGHRFDASGDHQVLVSGHDAHRGHVHRLLSGTAEAVQRDARNRYWPAGIERGHAGDVHRMVADA